MVVDAVARIRLGDNAVVIAQRFSGWLVGVARTLVLLVLIFAPLICLRFCQLRHAFAAHQQYMTCGDSVLPTDDSLLHDVQQLLSALTEFIPAAALIAFAILVLPRWSPCIAHSIAPQRRVPVPPPRPCCA